MKRLTLITLLICTLSLPLMAQAAPEKPSRRGGQPGMPGMMGMPVMVPGMPTERMPSIMAGVLKISCNKKIFSLSI